MIIFRSSLHMKMDAVNNSGRGSSLDASQSIHVAKIAYCDAHTPPGAQDKVDGEKSDSGEPKTPANSNKKQSFLNKLQARSECREKMKQVRLGRKYRVNKFSKQIIDKLFIILIGTKIVSKKTQFSSSCTYTNYTS